MAIARVLLILMALVYAVDFGCTVQYLTPDTELNPIAAKIWSEGGYVGLVALKILSLIIVVCAVELIGRISARVAAVVTLMAILISCVPLVMFGLLWVLP